MPAKYEKDNTGERLVLGISATNIDRKEMYSSTESALGTFTLCYTKVGDTYSFTVNKYGTAYSNLARFKRCNIYRGNTIFGSFPFVYEFFGSYRIGMYIWFYLFVIDAVVRMALFALAIANTFLTRSNFRRVN